ncbi:3-phosphoshikimate 1-carboxyvinyltransferase [Caproiciproducens sp. NJN-50]|uniref:3-phosphoshikimate 1-carboxyvinyltransferase n=1 Tax=Acutalibacteraceae TaxID=3082771 RepID=UPI000FFE2D69|nr:MULTISPECIES: 3-phosphoshikimate 1-carboxyvinyltransferase [Acutalibacteraceae]QAT50862.1 3-phosphoshikimate 1-carboxyvinyltransferase [Caproiciproducens sp. NJN-50]
MSLIRCSPAVLSGRVRVPISKSAAHRAMIGAFLAGAPDPLPAGETVSEDLTATRSALAALFAAERNGEPALADCGESGSTLRFLIPVAAALGTPAVFSGRGRLPQRPLGVYLDCLPRHGTACESAGGLPLSVSGKLQPGTYFLPGNVSSQFITGLMLALPLLDGDSEIRLTSPLESAGYTDMTIEILKGYGIEIFPAEAGWNVPGTQEFRPSGAGIERDWSQAAFFLAAGALGGQVELPGLRPDSTQGDRAAEELFRRFGARLSWNGGVLSAGPGELRGIEIDASQIPDLVPVLAVTAAAARGRTVIRNAGRLRLKESNRLAAMADGLRVLGAQVRETEDGLVIDGAGRLRGGTVEGRDDHRIVMAMAVAALVSDGDVTVTDAGSIRKSYPDFFRDYNLLGGKAYDLG